jgi:hypothetical protein
MWIRSKRLHPLNVLEVGESCSILEERRKSWRSRGMRRKYRLIRLLPAMLGDHRLVQVKDQKGR